MKELNSETKRIMEKVYRNVKPATKEYQFDLSGYIVEEKIRHSYPQEWRVYN